MKRAYTFIFVLVLGVGVASLNARTLPADNNVNVVVSSGNAESARPSAPSVETTITVTATPSHVSDVTTPQANRTSAAHPSNEDWRRCLSNDMCRPRNLYNNQWDRVFGPAYDFGN